MKDPKKVCFHSCAFNCTGTFYLCQALFYLLIYVTILFYRICSLANKGFLCCANTLKCKERPPKQATYLLTVPHQCYPKSIFKYSDIQEVPKIFYIRIYSGQVYQGRYCPFYQKSAMIILSPTNKV